MSEEEKSILQELLNEEIKSYLQSGYKITDEYVITLRNLLSKFDLKETYKYEWRKNNKNIKKYN